MDKELLYAKIEALEGKRPLARWPQKGHAQQAHGSAASAPGERTLAPLA
jgi:hypothetical protein